MLRKSLAAAFPILILCACTHVQGATIEVIDPREKLYAASFLSDVYTIDKTYPSMAGPASEQPITLLPRAEKDLLWLTGYDVMVTDTQGTPLENQKNLCHAQVTYEDAETLRRNTKKFFDDKRAMPPKWFIAIPGEASLQFPPGFGIPVYGNEPLKAMTMALNRDPVTEPFSVRMRTRLFYRRDDELQAPMQALGRFAVAVSVPVKDMGDMSEGLDDGCDISTHDGYVTFAKTVTGSNLFIRKGNSVASAHFMVSPGEHLYREPFHGADQIPFDTTLHFITAHLHPYGKYVELWDSTTNTMLFRSVATDDAMHRYVTAMTTYSDTKGIVMKRDHEYELRALYDNKTDHDIDGMAVMYMYFGDSSFTK